MADYILTKTPILKVLFNQCNTAIHNSHLSDLTTSIYKCSHIKLHLYAHSQNMNSVSVVLSFCERKQPKNQMPLINL